MWNDDNKKIFADREVILEALKSFSWAFEYADDSLKADREFMLEAVKNYDCTAMSIYRKDLAEQINKTIGKSLGIK